MNCIDIKPHASDFNIDTVFVPATCSGELQPLDLSVNKLVKDFLWTKFEDWYAIEIWEATQMLNLALH